MSVEIVNSIWQVKFFFVLVAFFFCNWLVTKIIRRLRKNAPAGRGWQVNLDQIVVAPIRLIFFSVGISYAATTLSSHFGVFEGAPFAQGRNACIVFALAWMAMRWKRVMLDHLLSTHSTSRGKHDHVVSIQLIFKLVTGAVAVFASLTMLHIFGINIMPLLAFSGIGAAAIGFAAKDGIANFFGGFMLFINCPFLEGDTIYLCNEEIEGLVEKIGWHTTIIRDKNKCPVYLPNALFSKALVCNRSRRSHQSVEETLEIGYEDAGRIPKLTEELRRVIAAHSEIDALQPIVIGVEALEHYALRIRIKMYTTAISENDYVAVRQEILLKIQALLEQNNFEMPLPTQAITLLPANQEQKPAFL